jgi:predicted molibdopterin-dependent oxidoreductase YjgC
LEFLAVEDCCESDLSRKAHVVLPAATYLEKDGSFTNADRGVQRVRVAVSPPGAARASMALVAEIARRLGYGLPANDPSAAMDEIAAVVPGYNGISFPRLERGAMQWPVTRFGTEQSVYLSVGRGLSPDAVRVVAGKA